MMDRIWWRPICLPLKQLLLARNRSPSQFHGRRQQLPRNRIRWKSWVCILPKNSNIRNHRQSTRQMWNRRIRRILPNLKNTRVTSNSDLEGMGSKLATPPLQKESARPIIQFADSDPWPQIGRHTKRIQRRKKVHLRCGSLHIFGTCRHRFFQAFGTEYQTHQGKVRSFGSSERFQPFGTESWTCQLCPGPTYSSVSGMRKHYWSHYRVWSASKNVLRDMDKDKRKHQDALKAEAQEREAARISISFRDWSQENSSERTLSSSNG